MREHCRNRIFLFLILLYPLHSQTQIVDQDQEAQSKSVRCAALTKYKQRYPPHCFCAPRPADALTYGIVSDIFGLITHLFSQDTLAILAGFAPFYAGARMVDDRLQSNFFCHGCHKNKCQMPSWCHDAVKWGLAVPIIGLGSLAVLSKDPEWRYTSWMMLIGMPFLIFGKDSLKNCEFDSCLRPWHEDFCLPHHKRSGGGCPSGHMAQAAYIAVLYGLRFGPKVGFPFAMYGLALGAIFVNCNRHYLSQMIAGAALGTIFAVAANKMVDHKLERLFKFDIGCDSYGNPTIGASITF